MNEQRNHMSITSSKDYSKIVGIFAPHSYFLILHTGLKSGDQHIKQQKKFEGYNC